MSGVASRTALSRAFALLLAGLALLAALAAVGALPWVVDVHTLLRTGLSLAALGAAAAALVLWRRTPHIGAGEVALTLAATALALGALEGYVRWREAAADTFGARYVRSDGVFGWTLKEGVTVRDRDGRRYSTTADGLRARRNAGAPRRVLVLGDSYTQAAAVDDDSTYWARLARGRPDLEFDVLGVGGWGTLQETMALERLAPRVRPTLVLWQAGSNDLTDNDFLLESRSLWNNNATRRPYWERGRIVYRDPARSELTARSALARVIAGHVRILRAERLGARSIEQDLPRRPADLARATAVTRELFVRARAVQPAIPMVAFLSDAHYPGDSVLAAARTAGFVTVPVAEVLLRARRSGAALDVSRVDAHWNARAHALAAAALDSVLARLLPSAPPPLSSPRSSPPAR